MGRAGGKKKKEKWTVDGQVVTINIHLKVSWQHLYNLE